MTADSAPHQAESDVLAALDLDHQQFAREGRSSLFGDAAAEIRRLRAALAEVRVPQVSTRRTDWGVRDDETGNVGTNGAYSRAATEEWLQWIEDNTGAPSTLMRRERTIYRDDVTEWAVAEPSEIPSSPASEGVQA